MGGGGSRGNGENKQERGEHLGRACLGKSVLGLPVWGPAAGVTGVVTEVRMRQESTPGPRRGPRAWSPKPERGAHRDECLRSIPGILLGH